MKWVLPVAGALLIQKPVQVDMAAGGDTSCYQESDQGKSYQGLVKIAENGETCTDYCRNEDGSEPKPWCHPVNNPEAKEPCSIPVCTAEGHFARDFTDEAGSLKVTISAPKNCKCADELYGSTTTTTDTRVGFLQKESKKPCTCTNNKEEPCTCTNNKEEPCDCNNKKPKKPCNCVTEPCSCGN